MINGLLSEIGDLERQFQAKIKDVQSQEAITSIRDQFLSRSNGLLTALLKKFRDLPKSDKPAAGSAINQLKKQIETGLEDGKKRLAHHGTGSNRFDFSLPHFAFEIGHVHLIPKIRTRIEEIFLNMGYVNTYGPEIESEFNNFTALNIPEFHPARDEQDTFFIKDYPGYVLRTHTSPVQIRYMKTNRPPIKIISPGKVFRKDEPDATHSPVFHQIEGLLVDEGINFSHLKGTLELFIKSFFGQHVTLRFRPGYFPFTEPSAEVDISCFLCFGKDDRCRVCKGTGWLEILGSGMVHPNVLENCGIDAEKFSGFAFGMGIERIAMLKYGVVDMRIMYENDLRFIRQFD